MEKLKLLSTPEERARRLNEELKIHADPTMDPEYESPEEQEQEIERSTRLPQSLNFWSKNFCTLTLTSIFLLIR